MCKHAHTCSGEKIGGISNVLVRCANRFNHVFVQARGSHKDRSGLGEVHQAIESKFTRLCHWASWATSTNKVLWTGGHAGERKCYNLT